MQKSLWQKNNLNLNFKSLDNNITTDILIIGAGITGVTLAYNLINSKHSVTLLDAEKLGNGVTAKSTGKITYLPGALKRLKKLFEFMYQGSLHSAYRNKEKLGGRCQLC